MKQREGELVIDHRFSPGLPAVLATSLGFSASQLAAGTVAEFSTLTCAHCKTVSVKNPLRSRPRASCFKCGNRYLCDNCGAVAAHPQYYHESFAQKLDTILEA